VKQLKFKCNVMQQLSNY